MAEFVFNLNAVQEAEETSGGSGFGTGLHKVFIREAYLTNTKGGNTVLNLSIAKKADGNGFGVQGFCIDEKWKSGAVNYDYTKWLELAKLAGMKTGEQYQASVKHFGEDIKAPAFKELIGKQLTLALQTEFDYYDVKDKVNENVKLYASFNAEGKSLTEVEKNKPAKKADKLEERLTDYHTPAYKAHMEGGSTDTGSDDAEDSAEDEVLF